MNEIPGGLGPWFCSLLFNTSETTKKQTHLIAHTYPHLAADALNKNSSSSSGGGGGRRDPENCWVVILKAGPFDQWDACVAYLDNWIQKTRGKARRLERGVELALETPAIKLWGQKRDREQALAKFQNHKFPPEFFDAPGGDEDADNDDNDEDADENSIMSMEEMNAVFTNDDATVKTIKQIHAQLTAGGMGSKKKQKK